MAATVNDNAPRGLSWNEVVVGGAEEQKTESLTEVLGSETQEEEKKVVWNKPSNGGGPEIGPVMGAVSWPTLSESTKAGPKPPAPDAPQVAIPVEPSPSAPVKHGNPNSPNPSGTQQHGRPARQRSLKREGGGSASVNGVSSHQPPPQSVAVGEASHDSNSSVRSGFGGSDGSGRDHHGHKSGYREGGQRGGYRRSNSGRGDGSFAGRRDQDRVNQEWNNQRSFNGRDNAGPPQRAGPRGFIRPPPGVASYPPPPLGPYTNPMSITPEMPLYYFASHPGMPFVAQMPPQFYTPPPFDPQLHAKILKQIDYYFSNENLIRDTYLRKNMDEDGWVPVQLISSFKKVTELTTNIQLILDVVRASTVVEVQGDKIRKRDDWSRWIMPPVQYPTASSSQSPRMPGQDTLSAHLQNLSVDENSFNSSGQLDIHAGGTLLRSSSGEMGTSKDGSSSNGR